MSLDDLAPDPEPEPELEVMSLDDLAPDPEPELEVMSLDDLAPDPEPEPELEVMSVDALAPDAEQDVASLDELTPAAPAAKEPAAPVQTRTLAELYVKQGFVDKALDVLRQLHAKHPGADDIARRIDELERGAQELARASLHVQSAPEDLDDDEGGSDEDLDAGDDGDEMEAWARDMAEGSAAHEVDTPFTWTESDAVDEPGTAEDGPRIGDYFDGLLAWEERDES
jgi:hypothetical protein